MPTTWIPNIGEVEYTYKELPTNIKGKSMIGVLDFPILINEDLGPGAKLDYVVAHEVGHRLTIAMIEQGLEDNPSMFTDKNRPVGSLIKYYIHLGLNKKDLDPLHPGIRAKMSSIFDENGRGDYTEEFTAREFIAEVYANWAMNKGNVPDIIAKRFRTITGVKQNILGLQPARREPEPVMADFNIDVTDEATFRWLLLGLIGFGVFLTFTGR